eukprot:1901441-Rhodomonas_salina.1
MRGHTAGFEHWTKIHIAERNGWATRTPLAPDFLVRRSRSPDRSCKPLSRRWRDRAGGEQQQRGVLRGERRGTHCGHPRGSHLRALLHQADRETRVTVPDLKPLSLSLSLSLFKLGSSWSASAKLRTGGSEIPDDRV